MVIFEGESFLCSSYMQHFILLVVPDCVCVCFDRVLGTVFCCNWALLLRWVTSFPVQWMWPRDTNFWVCA